MTSETASREGGVRSDSGEILIPRGTETLLLIDDDDLVLEMMEEWLGSLGYRVLVARSTDEALARLEDPGDLALAVSDIVMGTENGVEIVRLLRERAADLPVVFMSGYADGVLEATPNTFFVRKPFTLQRIAAICRHAIDHAPAVAVDDGGERRET